MVLLSPPQAYSAADLETWLGELIGVATEPREPEAPGPIPSLLHRALSGLLFSHAELWGRTPSHQPCSLACHAGDDALAFGWVGDADVCVWVNDEPVNPSWVRVRDSSGREARAMSIEPMRTVRVVLVWSSTAGDGTVRRAELTAEWAASDATVATDADRGPTGVVAVQPVDPPAASAGPTAEVEGGSRKGWQFRSWVDRLGLGVTAQPRSAESEHEERVPPTPEPQSLTDLTAPIPAEPGLESVFEMPTLASLDAPGAEVEEPPADVERAGPPANREAFESGREISDPAASPAPTTSDDFTIERVTDWVDAQSPFVPSGRGTEPVQRVESHAAAPADTGRESISWFTREADTTAAEGMEFLQPEPAEARPRSPASRNLARAWPDEPQRRIPWTWLGAAAGVIAVLFAFGWILGGSGARDRGPLASIGHALDVVGLGPGHFSLDVDSQPQGAWISVDGKDLGQRTPATLELRPGAHEIALGVQSLGRATFSVSGRRGERVPLAGQLWGSLSISSADPGVPVSVSVDATPHGMLPVTVDQLAPGIHKVEFTAPGVGGWEQTAEVRVHETAELVARPLAAAPNGYLKVQATLSTGGVPEALSGARVWVDGEPSGVTPLQLELPRGPHSVRIAWRTEASEVQVIDLPGGNTRFATFELGTVAIEPQVTVTPLPARIPLDAATVVSASLKGLPSTDLRELWLHVSTPEGAWRRYPMNLMRTPGNVVGAAVFPLNAFDPRGRARWYVSALVAAGDEYFTEITTIQSAGR